MDFLSLISESPHASGTACWNFNGDRTFASSWITFNKFFLFYWGIFLGGGMSNFSTGGGTLPHPNPLYSCWKYIPAEVTLRDPTVTCTARLVFVGCNFLFCEKSCRLFSSYIKIYLTLFVDKYNETFWIFTKKILFKNEIIVASMQWSTHFVNLCNFRLS